MLPHPFVEILTTPHSLVGQFLNQWLQSHFQVEGWELPIRVGEIHPQLEKALEETNSQEWIYITAYNPAPQTLPDAENIARNLDLEMVIQKQGFVYKKGRGIDEEGLCNGGKGEASFLVLGCPKSLGIQWMKDFGQLAIVCGRKSQPPILLFA